jgi:putative phosphotransacetylase
MDRESIEKAVREALASARASRKPPSFICDAPVGVSLRHVHLCAADLATLFGADASLTVLRELKQEGQFAANEQLVVAGPKNALPGVRILGPLRDKTVLELSYSDGMALGIALPPPPQETGGAVLVGPAGTVELKAGVGLAPRHLHLSPEEAKQLGITDGEMLTAWVGGPRAVVFGQIKARVTDWGRLELHLDADEGNAAQLQTGDMVAIGRGIFAANEEPSSPTPDDQPALKLITERDVLQAAKLGTELRLAKGGKITPLALDAIKRLGVRVLEDR